MRNGSDGDWIPAFLSIDVEPEAFQVEETCASPWAGFDPALALAASLRDGLARLQGRPARFGWYFRTDPQVAETCGRPDAVMHRFAGPIARLRVQGDYFGVHMHPIRRLPHHDRWVHDLADPRWLRQCVHASLDGFERWSGTRARLFRAGAGFMHEAIVDALDERGVAIEMSLEPIRSWGLDSTAVPTGVDDSPIVGSFVDCSGAPAVPYHPQRGDFRRRGAGKRARDILFVPLSAGPYSIPRAGWWPQAKRSLRRLATRPVRHMYYPTSPWPSPRYFWDVVEYSLSTMARPYLSLGIRTDREGSTQDLRVRAVLRELLEHPLASRLRFVNPLDAVDAIVDRRAPRAAAAGAATVGPAVAPVHPAAGTASPGD